MAKREDIPKTDISDIEGEAIELDPRHAIAYSNRGNARRASGDLAGAMNNSDQALILDPRCALALLNRGIGYLQLKQDIKVKGRRIQTLTERIKKLQSQPNPDWALIQDLKTDRQELEDELKTDRSQLIAFEEEFAASCGP